MTNDHLAGNILTDQWWFGVVSTPKNQSNPLMMFGKDWTQSSSKLGLYNSRPQLQGPRSQAHQPETSRSIWAKMTLLVVMLWWLRITRSPLVHDIGATPPGWWFQTWILFSIIYGIILPIDFHIFDKMVKTTNQTQSVHVWALNSRPIPMQRDWKLFLFAHLSIYRWIHHKPHLECYILYYDIYIYAVCDIYIYIIIIIIILIITLIIISIYMYTHIIALTNSQFSWPLWCFVRSFFTLQLSWPHQGTALASRWSWAKWPLVLRRCPLAATAFQLSILTEHNMYNVHACCRCRRI